DAIRNTSIAYKEMGGLTQTIGATEVPVDVIKKICGEKLIRKFNVKLTIPGLLFIDTPGHEVFTNLRKRGGSIADLAILAIDIKEGVQAQTIESLEILKHFKTGFVIALTKIDIVPGWVNQKTTCFLESIEKQSDAVKNEIDKKVYEIAIKLSEFGFDCERFDRVTDFTRQVAIIPVSAVTNEGIADLLIFVSGLAQKYLEKKLEIEVHGKGRGCVLEVKEEKGVGKTMDVILYDGKIKEGDTIVIAGIKDAIVTKVRALLKPRPLEEIREGFARFESVKEVNAAAGVKILATSLENVIAGMPMVVCDEKEIEKVKREVQADVYDVISGLDTEGVIVKADTLGSLEALIGIIRKNGLKVRKAEIGDVNKLDATEAFEIGKKDPYLGVIFAFNVKISPEASSVIRDHKVKVFTGNVIYNLIQEYEKWKKETMEQKKIEEMAKLTLPCKIRFLPGFVFRQSKPAIIGVEVIAGNLYSGIGIMNENGKSVGKIKEIQDQGKTIKSACAGMKVAVSIEGAFVNRTIKEGEIFYPDMSEEDFKLLNSKFKQELSNEDKNILDEIVKIKRKGNPLWGL
ncbi:MAG: translation initiation factor IF-2, partial [Candidatus Nanoarchaeia archaeon]|nr:translation initiation factor IF-2 [Candidatus Jingweiarchaeum tengchongense]